MRKLWTISSLAAFSLALAGCAQTVAVRTECPDRKTYSAAAQQKLAAEFPTLPADVRGLVDDYRSLRKECAALEK